MGFLDDSDSDSDMGDMSCSNVSMSFQRVSDSRGGGVPNHCRRNNNASKEEFKFGWDDSCLSVSKRGASSKRVSLRFGLDDSACSSVNSDYLDNSDSSCLDISNSNYRRNNKGQQVTPLGRVLEQVDGVKYKDAAPKRGSSLLLQLYGNSNDDDEESEEDLLLPVVSAPEKLDMATLERDILVSFQQPLVTDQLDYVQSQDAVLSVWDEHHVAESHNQVPWDEQDYEELPWHLQPDLDEDDPITKICRAVICGGKRTNEDEEDNGDTESEEDISTRRHIDRVEALVICFALKLKYRRLQKQSPASLSLGKDGMQAKVDDDTDSTTESSRTSEGQEDPFEVLSNS